jgi:alanine-glyoxylate transaminase/serine-glyoxylate transaminase/serine-pyruvate transaminase
VENPLNMSTGPVECSRPVLAALATTFGSPHRAEFWTFHDDLAARLGKFLDFDGPALMLHGSIRTGLYLALANLVRPGMRVLALDNGYWGRLLGDAAAELGADVRWLRDPWSHAFRGDAVARALREHPATALVTAVHVETSTGLRNRIDEIGPAVRAAGGLFLVDSACSAGAVPFQTDGWCVDIGVTGSQKGFGAVAGLAILTINDRAWRRAEHSLLASSRTYSSLCFLRDQILLRAGPPWYTQPAAILGGLDAALCDAETLGQAAWFERHRKAAAGFLAGIAACGGRSVLAGDGAVGGHAPDQSDTVMVIRYPEGVGDADFRRLLWSNYGIFVIGNIGEFAGTSFRVGLMSAPQIDARNLARTLDAIAAGFGLCRGEARATPTEGRTASREN